MMKMRVPKKRKKLLLRRSVFLLLHCLAFRCECGNIQKCMLQVEVGNKRPANSSSKTPDPEKKAKLVSSGGNQKSGRYLSPLFLIFDIGNLYLIAC